MNRKMVTTHSSALLVLDMQVSILNKHLTGAASLINGVATAIAVAREKKLPVIYVVSGFRNGAPDLSANNKFYSENADYYRAGKPEDMQKIHPSVEPEQNDIIIHKRRFGAFEGTDLELVLRSLNIQHIILSGFSTGGVILSTIRSGADKDYRITLLSDACTDKDEELHHVLLTKVFPRQADVIMVDDWKQKTDAS